MHLTLPLLLAATLPAAAPPNIDFSTGKLTHWQGDGFAVADDAVSSASAKGPKAILHRTFTVPPGTTAIRFRAAAVRPEGVKPEGDLEVYLEGANRDFAPRHVRQGEKWVKAPALLAKADGQLREYSWAVEKFAGKRVRIALVDSDPRPGCHVLCTGFLLSKGDSVTAAQFLTDMRQLQQKHKLPRLIRYDSKHFMALSNADPEDTRYRLANCEAMHADFFKHFRKRGFEVKPPAEKLMVAVFSTQEGLEAYIGQRLSSAITGLYHTSTNRLVVYDYAGNRDYAAGKKRLEENAKSAKDDRERQRRLVQTSRLLRDREADTNISTVMHETAHQLSFNGGLLNRQGDVPAWVAEGLAMYCEPTVKGEWQGIGEPNPPRAAVLRRASPMPLRELVESDDWLRKAKTVDAVILGYSQSWALFRLLMEERPKQLKAYLKLIYPRRTPDHRLADFGTAFGADLAKLERRYQEYMRELPRR